MRTPTRPTCIATLLTLLASGSSLITAAPLGTAFTYQGKLTDGGAPANGSYDLRFILYDADVGGNQVGPILTNAAVPVSGGLFAVPLDFGGGVFTRDARCLEISVRTNGVGAFATLSPRQPLAPAPYALHASTAGQVAAANVVGTLADAQLSTNVARLSANQTFAGAVQFLNRSNGFTGDGTGLTNVDLVSLNTHSAITPETGWQLVDSPVVGLHPRALIAASLFGTSTQLVTADSDSDRLSVLTNTGGGSVALASTWTVGRGPSCVVAAEVNGDTRLDLISANSRTNTLSVLTNTGGLAFALASAPALLGNPASVAAADLNHDGRTELAVTLALTGQGFPPSPATNLLMLLTNDGRGGFGVLTGAVFQVRIGPTNISTNLYLLPTGESADVVATDANGDTWPDLVCTTGNNTLLVVTNDRLGGFRLAATLPTGTGPVSPVAVDLNGDGAVDLVCANSSGSTVSVFTNNGSGRFTLMASPGAGWHPSAVAAADLNGDGLVDLVSATAAGTLTVLTNNGAGGFAVMATPAVGPSPMAVAALDLNSDGRLDLVSANSGADTLSVLWANQLLGFAFAGDFSGNFTGNGAGLTSLDATHIVNAGSGSGLDADLVDRLHASAFALASGSPAYVAKSGDTMTGALQVPTDGLIAGANQLVLSGGNIGIGTASPGAPLEIAGYGNNLKLTRPGVSAAFGVWEGFWGNTPQLAMGNWDTGNGLAIDTNGNVGIGTFSPQTKLDVAGTVKAASFVGSGAGLSDIRFGTPIPSAPYTISQPGAYFLTNNLTVAGGDALTITTNGVTLDLGGFTIFSTAASATGSGIRLNGRLSDITIVNGHIMGGVTNNAGTYNGPGFQYGIRPTDYAPGNTRVYGVSVSGCASSGMAYLGRSSVVESCTVHTVGGSGIIAGTIKNSVAVECGGDAIYGDQISDCRGESTGYGYGVHAANTAQNCYGYCPGGTGVYANTAQNCYGQGNSGVYAVVTAQNCIGSASDGTGLYAGDIAIGCRGGSGSGTGLSAYIANSCRGTSMSGTQQVITYKYNMP